MATTGIVAVLERMERWPMPYFASYIHVSSLMICMGLDLGIRGGSGVAEDGVSCLMR
jgi:hypothetical protein